MPEETPKALAAFERYWAMGPMRSLAKLAENDVEQKHTESIASTHLAKLSKWSTEHGWQARVKARVIEEADLAREQYRERADKHRQRLLAAIETDSARYVERLRNSEGEVMADDAYKLEKLTKLYYQLAEQPLADRHEVTGDITTRVIATPEQVALAAARETDNDSDGNAADNGSDAD